MDGWMDKYMDIQPDGWVVDEWMDGDKQIDGWIDRYLDKCIDGWMDGVR